MDAYMPWPWGESLGGLNGGEPLAFRVRRVLFGLVRDRCAQLGLEEGMVIRCLRRTREAVTIELPDGSLREMELAYAWFVQVEPTSLPLPVPVA